MHFHVCTCSHICIDIIHYKHIDMCVYIRMNFNTTRKIMRKLYMYVLLFWLFYVGDIRLLFLLKFFLVKIKIVFFWTHQQFTFAGEHWWPISPGAVCSQKTPWPCTPGLFSGWGSKVDTGWKCGRVSDPGGPQPASPSVGTTAHVTPSAPPKFIWGTSPSAQCDCIWS